MSEYDMRRRVRRALEPLHAIPVENVAHPGTPDLNYVEGWLELKWLRQWPRGVVRIPHWTITQRMWHLRRRAAGGCTWVLLQCKREWLLFAGETAALELGFCARMELIQLADIYNNQGLVAEELIACISTEQSVFSLTDDVVLSLREKLRNDSTLPTNNTAARNYVSKRKQDRNVG